MPHLVTLNLSPLRDVDGLRPHLSWLSWTDYLISFTIHWVKLYKHDNQSFGSLIADVAFDIDFLDGQAEFLLPEVDPGLYFLAGMYLLHWAGTCRAYDCI